MKDLLRMSDELRGAGVKPEDVSSMVREEVQRETTSALRKINDWQRASSEKDILFTSSNFLGQQRSHESAIGQTLKVNRELFVLANISENPLA